MATLNNFSKVTPEIEKLALLCSERSIAPELYTKHDVKRGLRDVNGKGVLTGLTEISEIISSKKVDGKSVPCEGELYYRGYNVKDLVKSFIDEDRFGFEESEPQVAIAKLFKWAYAVRLDLEYLGPNTPNKYALGGDGNYANRIALFAKIKNAREHSEITDMALNVASKEHTDNGKWGFLRDMLVEL